MSGPRQEVSLQLYRPVFLAEGPGGSISFEGMGHLS